jgi:hypothetical protein
MRGALRVANVFVWFGLWLAVAVIFNALNDISRMMGQAVIPLILCLVIDRGLRVRRAADPEQSR